MTERITLPGGAWADLRDSLADAPRRLTKAITAASAKAAALPHFQAIRQATHDGEADVASTADALRNEMTPAEIAEAMPIIEETQDVQALALIEAWSYQHPLTREGLEELPTGAYDVLIAEAGKRANRPMVASEKTLAAMADPTPALVASSASVSS